MYMTNRNSYIAEYWLSWAYRTRFLHVEDIHILDLQCLTWNQRNVTTTYLQHIHGQHVKYIDLIRSGSATFHQDVVKNKVVSCRGCWN